jgi:hypothetical protein
MIRRLFWVIVGALLGVTGYRRVSRLARTVTLRGPAPGLGRRPDWAAGATRFARDVRDGMELYNDRHPRLAGRDQEDGPPAGRRYPSIDYAKDGR